MSPFQGLRLLVRRFPGADAAWLYDFAPPGHPESTVLSETQVISHPRSGSRYAHVSLTNPTIAEWLAQFPEKNYYFFRIGSQAIDRQGVRTSKIFRFAPKFDLRPLREAADFCPKARSGKELRKVEQFPDFRIHPRPSDRADE
jgi:hypothetical protein